MDKFLKYIGSTSLDSNPHNLSEDAKQLIVDALDDIDEIYDMHTHLGGSETDVTGCCIHPNLSSMKHPFNFGQQIVGSKIYNFYPTCRLRTRCSEVLRVLKKTKEVTRNMLIHL